MNERSQKVRLGLFALFALMSIGVLVILFGKKPSWLTSRTEYKIIYENAPGIQNGTPVRRSGVKIGEVSGLEIVESDDEHPENVGKVRVSILVNSKFLPRKNETPSIAQSLLSGDSAIDFVVIDQKQKPVPEPLPNDKPIPGRGPLDPRSTLDTAQANVYDSLKKVSDTFERFNKVAPDVEAFLREYALLSRSLRETVPELRQTNDSLRRLADETRTTIPIIRETSDEARLTFKNWGALGESANVLLMTNRDKISLTIDRMAVALEKASATMDRANKVLTDENMNNVRDTLKNTRSASEKFDRTLTNFDQLSTDGSSAMKRFNESMAKADKIVENLVTASQPLAERSDAITKNLMTTTVEANRLMADIRGMVGSFGQGNGTLQRLLSDPSLYNNANETALMLARLMPRLERILAEVEIFSDKIARHPEDLGLHGVFKPNSGLKNAPSAAPMNSWHPPR